MGGDRGGASKGENGELQSLRRPVDVGAAERNCWGKDGGTVRGLWIAEPRVMSAFKGEAHGVVGAGRASCGGVSGSQWVPAASITYTCDKF